MDGTVDSALVKEGSREAIGEGFFGCAAAYHAGLATNRGFSTDIVFITWMAYSLLYTTFTTPIYLICTFLTTVKLSAFANLTVFSFCKIA